MTAPRVLILSPDGTAVVGGVKCKLVPVEPTKEMVDASWDRDAWIGGFPKKWSGADSYAAMLSAAAIDLSGLPTAPILTRPAK